MTDAITIDHIQTETSYNLEKLFNEANQFDNDNLNDSPFSYQTKGVIDLPLPEEELALPVAE